MILLCLAAPFFTLKVLLYEITINWSHTMSYDIIMLAGTLTIIVKLIE